MRIAVSGYRFPLRVMGLVSALVLLAGACSPPGTPAATPTEATPTWDYVALGHGIPGGVGVGGRSYVVYYAEHMEADLGVKVTLHRWTRGGQTSGGLLHALRNDEELRSDISEAEVVTFFTWPGPGYCAGVDREDCFEEPLPTFRANLDAIIAEILSLRSTSDTIIRTVDWFYPYVNENKERGVFEDCKRCLEALNEQVVQAASEHNIPVARTYSVFNGPDGDEDARDKGYVQADGIHPSEAGHRLIADLHRELGYEPLGP